ncbi:MAG: PP0621 family protein [Oceanococcus sp.]
MMILLRVVLLLGICFLIWKAWRVLRPAKPPSVKGAFEPMVQCQVCAVHIPRAQAIKQEEAYFCQQHASDAPKNS